MFLMILRPKSKKNEEKYEKNQILFAYVKKK